MDDPGIWSGSRLANTRSAGRGEGSCQESPVRFPHISLLCGCLGPSSLGKIPAKEKGSVLVGRNRVPAGAPLRGSSW